MVEVKYLINPYGKFTVDSNETYMILQQGALLMKYYREKKNELGLIADTKKVFVV